MQISRARIAPFAVLAGLAVTGCSFYQSVGNHATSYNLSLEDTTNRVMLRNILRAKDRIGRHYSTVTGITDSIRVTPSLTTIFPFGQPHVSRTAGPGIKATLGPTFDWSPEHSQDFMKGITQPISMEIFDLYWQQGRPKDMLLHLFVSKIEITPTDYKGVPLERAGKKVITETYTNSPASSREGAWKKYENFRDKVIYLTKNMWILNRTTTTYSISEPPLNPKKVTDPDSQVKIKDAGMKIVCKEGKKPKNIKWNDCNNNTPETQKRYYLVKPKTVTKKVFCISNISKDTRPSYADCPGNLKPSTDLGTQTKFSLVLPLVQPDETKNKFERWVFHIRSVEGIIYYLGEVVRADERDGNIVRIKWRDKENIVPLFLVKKEGFIASRNYVRVTHRGDTYIIPNSVDNRRSMQVLGLLSELFALNRQAKDLPRSLTVTTIGGS